ncbi:MAG: lipopolysaccharide biosynthesis protein RfbH [Candidatus Omnitrophica bacterium]|nr:lipopolysaccharide biosynthesis protein RfbH [Candidatus Omnitrophota bacterium]
MNNQKLLRKQILKKVKDFQVKSPKSKFVPGETYINYAGRIFDHEELINSVDASLDFWLTSGRFACEFEKELARFLGIKHCMLTNSGSSANLLAISALKSPLLKKRSLKAGDEVITTACGFPTTLNPILQNNLVPVFVDLELGTYNIDVTKIERAISKKTKAIFVAHTLGNPVELDAIMKIVKKHNLFFIEDNCDSLGSKYNDKYTGSFGQISTCSFYASHHITMGEGGAVLTNDPLLRKIILSLRDWGRDCFCEPGRDNSCGKRFSKKQGKLPLGYDHKYIYSHIGYNLKITDMQAAIGLAQLKKLKNFISIRRKNFDYLYKNLSQYDKYIAFPKVSNKSKVSWFGFPVLIKSDAPFKRIELVRYLEKNKIATRMLFGGNLTKQPAYQGIKYRVSGSLNNTNLVMDNLFWIGVYPGITKDKLDYIAKIFSYFFKKL